MKLFTIVFLASFLMFHVPVSAISAKDSPASTKSPKESHQKEFKEEKQESKHTMSIGGKTLRYKATAGTMILKDEKEKPKASVFYVAYTKDNDMPGSERPITFCFNGGPGSSAVWLHMGAFGPKRVHLNPGGAAAPPYETIENQFSILDITDLVFIDPVSTGHSRAFPGEDPSQFHGVEEDIASVGDFIRLYATRNQRWTSPKFLAGESYGTTRAAGLVGYLQDHHRMYVDGVVLLSSVLNFQTIIDGNRGNDLPYLLYLPSYTAAAWHHKKLCANLLNQPLPTVLQQAEEFVINVYSKALMKGNRLPENEKKIVTEKLAYFTGLSQDYVARSNLRINIHRFCRELLRDQSRSIGRFDSRQKGIEADGCGEMLRNDPSFDAIVGGFAAASNHYLSRELRWEEAQPYYILTHEVWPWNFGKSKNEYLSVAETLREIMTRNPHLKVFVGSGYFDLATPYFATDYTIDHLGLDPALENHITTCYYNGGHMMYTDYPSLIKLKEDLKRFYEKKLK